MSSQIKGGEDINKTLVFCIACLIAFCAVGEAKADSYERTASISLQPGNWIDYLEIPKFNVAGCNLESIELTLLGYIEGTARFESLDASPSTVRTYLTADLELERPDGSLMIVKPEVTTVDQVTAYDTPGELPDFGGTSGRTHAGLTASATESWVSTLQDDLDFFTGSGDVLLQAMSTGRSYASGPGNIISWFTTETSAEVTVKYIYTAVPEPSGAIALFSGMAGLYGFVRLRRRN